MSSGTLPFRDRDPVAPAPAATAPAAGSAATRKRVFLLDGTALAYRGHFALVRQPLTNSKGQNVSALFVFAQTLLSIMDKERPDFIAVAFDPKGKTFRHDRFADYKATREKTPDELIALIPAIRELVLAFNIPFVEVPGYEADDVIATLTRQAEQAGHDVMIVTGDKDFLQIVSPTVKLYNVLRPDRQVEIQGAEAAEAKFGVGPEHVIDVLALMGDASDNVPGVAGIGPKTATELNKKFGSLDALYARLPEVDRASVREKLELSREQAFLSRELVKFHFDAPVQFDEASFRRSNPDAPRLLQLLKTWEMNSLIDRVRVAPPAEARDYTIVRDRAGFDALLAGLRAAKSFAFDTETTDIDPLRARLVGMSFSFASNSAWYLPANCVPPVFADGNDADHFVRELAPVFADRSIKKCGQNAKYDLLMLRRVGLEVANVDFDTMVASYCVAPHELAHNLDHLALKYLSLQKIPTSALIGKGKQQITMDQVPIDKVGEYACEDADVTFRLVPLLEKEMNALGVAKLFHEVEMPLVRVLEAMERAGVAIDVDVLRRIGKEFDERLTHLTTEIHEAAGEVFNINSPQQLGKILFEKLEVHKACGIQRPRRTQTGWSTDAAVLESLAKHPLAAKLLEFRALVKLKGTYVDALPELVNPETGRIHTSFNQAVASTGRLSSSDPNLQNIPIRTPEGRQIRTAFVASGPDAVLLSADYSQIELRILAHLSGDENLIRAFRERQDVHRSTAALIFGMKPDEVPDELRARAKTINFGVIYGMGAQRLAAQTGMTQSEAAQFIEAYFKTFSGVRRWLDDTLAAARRDGYVTTMLGRRRPLAELDSEHPRIAAMARNMAVNTPIQGTAADLIKVAMVRIHERLGAGGYATQMILQVHDELVFDVPNGELDAIRELVRETMEGALSLSVPLVVDVGVGKNWLEAH